MKFKDVTPKHTTDTGMALVLICLLLGNVILQLNLLNYVAIILIVATMGASKLFKPAAVVWFSISQMLGAILSRIILTIIFFVVLTPIGMIMNLIRRDPLEINAFKISKSSVFKFCGLSCDSIPTSCNTFKIISFDILLPIDKPFKIVFLLETKLFATKLKKSLISCLFINGVFRGINCITAESTLGLG